MNHNLIPALTWAVYDALAAIALVGAVLVVCITMGM